MNPNKKPARPANPDDLIGDLVPASLAALDPELDAEPMPEAPEVPPPVCKVERWSRADVPGEVQFHTRRDNGAVEMIMGFCTFTVMTEEGRMLTDAGQVPEDDFDGITEPGDALDIIMRYHDLHCDEKRAAIVAQWEVMKRQMEAAAQAARQLPPAPGTLWTPPGI